MLTVLITFFAIPIGLLLIFKEQRDQRHYQAVFDTYFYKVKVSYGSEEMKISKLCAMLEHNYYHIISIENYEIQAERKIFSVGWLIFSLGFFYIGALFYIIYFYKFKKSHKIHFNLK